MKAIQCAALLLATAALLGCAPIDKLRQQDAQVAPDTVAPATLLKAAVLEDLRLRGQDPAKNFGAFFVYVDKTEIPFFEKLFKDNIPRAEFSSGSQGRFANLDDSDGGVTDRRTGKPGAIFGFPKVEIRNGRAYVELIESYGLLGVTAHEYSLSLANGKWTIRKHSRKAVS